MCGITFGIHKSNSLLHLGSLNTLVHRGPDSQGFLSFNIGSFKLELAHTHLCINGIPGTQPFNTIDASLIVNGEIYNYKELEKLLDYPLETKSDCEILLPLYKKYDLDMFKYINGQFSFVLVDKQRKRIIISRDSIGITSLYTAHNTLDDLVFTSELKTLDNYSHVKIFEPASYLLIDLQYDTLFMKTQEYTTLPENDDYVMYSEPVLKHTLEKAITLRIPNSCEYGFLLSGGLDSSIIAAVAAKHSRLPIKTFSIGLSPDSPDLLHARIMAKHINSNHHEILYTIEEGIQTLQDTIHYVESCDTTTVRSSTPMLILGRKIKQLYPSLKVLLSGEGSDELFGGYLYFKNAPTPTDFHNECIERTKNLHKYDCQRAHKSLLASGIECRVPFLDKNVVEYALRIDPLLKMHKVDGESLPEKYILRRAFKDLLPPEITWRVKDQFSDAVGYNWITELKKYADINTINFTEDEPNETVMYRNLYNTAFKIGVDLIPSWQPKWTDDLDPSGQQFLNEI
ncbi:glutamine-hydrolyzing asparagine synthase [Mimivirus AB-566-O17]|uniref:asparagine synthase (glutamine-hydrolyzing) n=1 Tax=Mimivirus AB-566-O17 TaxID=1988039 RepID=A0A1X9VNR2_9VIRU|nr:glutamine-hydrolyzing asparagine synthase [Mimivirus AB-566-O17]